MYPYTQTFVLVLLGHTQLCTMCHHDSPYLRHSHPMILLFSNSAIYHLGPCISILFPSPKDHDLGLSPKYLQILTQTIPERVISCILVNFCKQRLHLGASFHLRLYVVKLAQHFGKLAQHILWNVWKRCSFLLNEPIFSPEAIILVPELP